jgi:hypothetical protein
MTKFTPEVIINEGGDENVGTIIEHVYNLQNPKDIMIGTLVIKKSMSGDSR